MPSIPAFLRSLRNPVRQIQLLMVLGGLFVAYALLSATGAPPKPWENDGPAYVVGEMADFTRTFPSAPLPDVRVVADGEEVPLRQFAGGKPLVVNLWATWCAPCLEELPSLAALQEELGDQVQVLAIAAEGGDGTRQRAMLERLGAENLTFVLDPKLRAARSYEKDLSLPLTILYDGRGREIGRVLGAADWSSPEATRLVRAVAAGEIPR